jgi:soluble lytic murein transglycosylase-like protein
MNLCPLLYSMAAAGILGLTVAAAGQAAAVPPPVAAPGANSGVDQWAGFIDEAAQRFVLPSAWIRAVMQAESGGHTMRDGHPIVSRAGAMGLMQVMPATYAAMRAAWHLGPNPFDPHDNIMAGAAFLRAMFDRYGYPGLFAAYNAGPQRYDATLQSGAPLPHETQRYIAALNQAPPSPALPPTILSGTRLFFTLHGVSGAIGDPEPSSQPTPPVPVSGGLFVPLSTPLEQRPGNERRGHS